MHQPVQGLTVAGGARLHHTSPVPHSPPLVPTLCPSKTQSGVDTPDQNLDPSFGGLRPCSLIWFPCPPQASHQPHSVTSCLRACYSLWLEYFSHLIRKLNPVSSLTTSYRNPALTTPERLGDPSVPTPRHFTITDETCLVCFPLPLSRTDCVDSGAWHNMGAQTTLDDGCMDGRWAVSYTHLTLPTILGLCRSRWSPYH